MDRPSADGSQTREREASAHALLPDWLSAGAFLHPDRLALVGDERRWTYSELLDRVERLASVLAELGAGTDTRIALLAQNGPAVIETIFAAARIGAAVIPLNHRLVGPEIAYQIEDSCAEIALVDPDLAELAEHGGLTERAHLVFGPAFEARVAGAERYAGPRPRAEAVLIQLYTSGTTGRPKGCMLSQANWVAASNGFAGGYGMTHRDVVMTTMPLFHVAGLGWCMATLMSGGTMVVPTRFDAERCWDVAGELGLTIAVMPFNLREALAHPGAAAGARTLRMIQGAVPQPPSFIAHVEFVGGYGATEMCGQSTVFRGRDGPMTRGSIGRPINGYVVKIVDAEGQAVEIGEVGELLLRGPAITRGYWRLPEASEALLEGDWMHSGDLVRADEEGRLYFVDRLKDMIKTGGENVYSAEVEAVLNRHPDVVEVAVFGVSDPRWGQAVKAVIVTRSPNTPEATARALDAWCLERLAPYKRPRWFDFADGLPRNATSKITKAPLIAAHDPATSIRLAER